MDINSIKGSIDLVNNSLKVYGDENISDSLLKSNLLHILNAASEISSELNRRQLFNEQI